MFYYLFCLPPKVEIVIIMLSSYVVQFTLFMACMVVIPYLIFGILGRPQNDEFRTD